MSANGKLATADLMAVPATVAGAGFLRRDAASQYGMLAHAFEKAHGHALVITEGYRTYGRQVEYWNRYQAGTGNLAAYPGTSNHGWGISCDFGSGVASAGSSEKRWMDAHAPAYGWQPTGNTFGRPEPWHFDYVPAKASITTGPSIFDSRTSSATPATPPPPPPTEETPMFLSRRPQEDGGTIGLFGIPGRGWLPFMHKAHYEMFRNIFIDSGVKLAGGIDFPEWKNVAQIRPYPGVTWDNLVIAHTPPTAPAPDGVDEAAIVRGIISSLKTTTALRADVDESAVAALLSPLVTRGVLDGMAARLKS